MTERQLEALLAITLQQRDLLAEQLRTIEENPDLSPDEKLDLMASILKPIQRIKE